MASDPPTRPQESPSLAAAARPEDGPAVAVGNGAPPRLDLGDAIHDGWQAFCRAPRAFAAYALLVNLLLLATQALMARIGSRAHPSADPAAWLLFLLGLGLALLLNLWAQLSLVRAAWRALEGGRPTLGGLLRFDGAAALRLLRAWLRLVGLIGLPGGAALVLFGLPLLVLAEPVVQRSLGLPVVRLLALSLAALLLLVLALTLTGLLYVAVNQLFLAQIVGLEGWGGAAAVERGRRLVDPQWPLVLLLLIATVILNGLGLLACVVGSLVAWPATVCIATAAFRQLRRDQPPPGVLAPLGGRDRQVEGRA